MDQATCGTVLVLLHRVLSKVGKIGLGLFGLADNYRRREDLKLLALLLVKSPSLAIH